MTTGPLMFVRFGFPPNALGYCGPEDPTEVSDLAAADGDGATDLRHMLTAFQGAWPYLELIASRSGRSPLDEDVVEAYWLGNALLDRVDLLSWGNSLDDRFSARTGADGGAITAALNRGGLPNHAFHVFCVYPWVGLLRTGTGGHALEVLDRCRIRWGRVQDVSNGSVLVSSQPLAWRNGKLLLDRPAIESVTAPIDGRPGEIRPGDRVAMHWNYVCQVITDTQQRRLRRNHDRHLAIANTIGRRLSRRIEA